MNKLIPFVITIVLAGCCYDSNKSMKSVVDNYSLDKAVKILEVIKSDCRGHGSCVIIKYSNGWAYACTAQHVTNDSKLITVDGNMAEVIWS